MDRILNMNYVPFLLLSFAVIFIMREVAVYLGKRDLKYLLTPLVTASIFAFAILSLFYYPPEPYRIFILAGLVFSLIADTMLMIEEVDLLPHGIVFFMITHLMYISAFSRGYSFQAWHVLPAVLLAAGIAVHYRLVVSRAESMRVPVLVYITIICIMTFFAWTGPTEDWGGGKVLAAAGGTLFLFSDIVLSVNAFVSRINHSSVITWSLYAPAQLCIALSCLG